MVHIDLRKRVNELVGDVMTMPDGGATADLLLDVFREWLNAPGHLNRYGYELADLIGSRDRGRADRSDEKPRAP